MSKIKFSIVIALAPWREAEILSSISKLNYPKNKFEVIIQKGLNVPDNRNNGVKKAKGEIIVFLDDDGIIKSDFLKNVESFFDTYPQVDILGGPQLTPSSDKGFAKISGYALSDGFGAFGVNKRYKSSKLTLKADGNYITGALMIIRKKVFADLSFDRDVYPSDDFNFVNTARERGFTVAYSPDIVIYHRRRASLSGLIKQIFDYGKSKTQKDGLKHISRYPYILIPSIFLIYLLLLPTLASTSYYFIYPLYLYFVLVILFTLYNTLKNLELPALILLPIIYVAIHLSYGLGFIVGVLNKLRGKNVQN